MSPTTMTESLRPEALEVHLTEHMSCATGALRGNDVTHLNYTTTAPFGGKMTVNVASLNMELMDFREDGQMLELHHVLNEICAQAQSYSVALPRSNRSH